MSEVPSKPWYLSKTMWVQIATIVTGTLSIVAASPLIKDNPMVVAVIGTIAIPTINMIVRVFTEGKVTLGNKPKV